jgi:hypothetical protein
VAGSPKGTGKGSVVGDPWATQAECSRAPAHAVPRHVACGACELTARNVRVRSCVRHFADAPDGNAPLAKRTCKSAAVPAHVASAAPAKGPLGRMARLRAEHVEPKEATPVRSAGESQAPIWSGLVSESSLARCPVHCRWSPVAGPSTTLCPSALHLPVCHPQRNQTWSPDLIKPGL